MRPSIPGGLGPALAWFAFPLVPALLGTTCYQGLNAAGRAGGPDPRDWGGATWIVMVGPLFGYGFLAGATLDLPDDPSRSGWKGWLSKRSLWVGIGPWLGFLAWSAVLMAIGLLERAYPPSQRWFPPPLPESWRGTWAVWLAFWFAVSAWIGLVAYAWLALAWLVLRRARRFGRLGRAIAKGLAVAVGFVGSLFGAFWAITEAWRDHFFDPRIAPSLAAATSLVLLSGCSNTETLGELRRRELFGSMLVAWLLGLALTWRWWSRSMRGPRP